MSDKVHLPETTFTFSSPGIVLIESCGGKVELDYEEVERLWLEFSRREGEQELE